MFKRIVTAMVAVIAAVSVSQACEQLGAAGVRLEWKRPLPDGLGTATDGFGMQRHPLLGFNRPHTGQDWTAIQGTDVRAAAAGLVVAAARKGEFGNYIRIDHGGGWETTYSHLQRFNVDVTAGRCVSAGQSIATLGSTGLTAGPLLHFELLRDGSPIDPMVP
jgi:murein DD-endopeptidase MepM/ murein hydrolase activator NlpD